MAEAQSTPSFYPSMPAVQGSVPPAAPGASAFTGDIAKAPAAAPAAAVTKPGAPEPGSPQAKGEALFGGNAGGGDVPIGDYSAHGVDDFLGAYEQSAREAGNDADIDLLLKTREGLNSVMTEHQVGTSEAKELMALSRQYFQTSRTPESIAEEMTNTVGALKEKWGGDYQANLSRAQAVINAMAAKIPNLKARLSETGLGNSQKFIEQLAAIGGRKR